jgi:phosphatidylserine decarboxylase
MIARGGGGPLAALGAGYAGLLALFLITSSLLVLILLVLGAVFLLLMVNFFRDPERVPGEGIVAPADGVVSIVESRGGSVLIATFMNVHDVHVNRAPVECIVRKIARVAGPKRAAFSDGAEKNNRTVYTLETSHGVVTLTQIAGAFARRVLPYAKEGQRLAKGERLGIIRFGSRVDVELPAKSPAGTLEPRVKKGERVRAGESTLAVYR